MKKEWKLEKLGNVCNFVRGPFGGSLKKSSFKSTGIAVYEQRHAIYNQFDEIRYFIDDEKFEEMKRFELEPGDLIMSCSGTMGKVAVVPENAKKGIINQALLKLTPSAELNVKYLEYWMNSPNFQESLARSTVGAAIKNVASVKILKEIEIYLPNINTQNMVVNKLDEAFKIIGNAQDNIEKNILNADSLFQSNLNDLFSNQSWERFKFSELFKLQSGDGLTAKNIVPGDYPVYGGNGIAGYHNEYNINGPVVIIGRVGALCGNVRLVEEKLWLTDNAFKISNDLEVFNLGFLTYMLNFLDLRRYARQTAQPVISNSSLKNVIVSYPTDLNEQLTIKKNIENLECHKVELKALYSKKLSQLNELKQSILLKAFSGDLI